MNTKVYKRYSTHNKITTHTRHLDPRREKVDVRRLERRAAYASAAKLERSIPREELPRRVAIAVHIQWRGVRVLYALGEVCAPALRAALYGILIAVDIACVRAHRRALRVELVLVLVQ